MSGLVQAVKAFGLFYLGHMLRDWLLGTEGYSLLLLYPLYYLLLIWVVFKYATSFTHSKVSGFLLQFRKAIKIFYLHNCAPHFPIFMGKFQVFTLTLYG